MTAEGLNTQYRLQLANDLTPPISRQTKGGVPDLGEDDLYVTAISPGKPTLLLTHLPLHEVPRGMVNVHGHSHRANGNWSGPYLNVCVERTGYRPIRMSEVRKRAKKLARPATSPRRSASLQSG